jgi:hypothetical protein
MGATVARLQQTGTLLTPVPGSTIAQAVSRRLPTVADRVRARVRSYGICGGQSDTANRHSTNCSTVTIIYHLGLVQEASSGRNTEWTQVSRYEKIIITKILEYQSLRRRGDLPPRLAVTWCWAQRPV